MNPYISDSGSGSSMDQSINQLNNEAADELRDLQLALGKIPSDYHGGGKPKYDFIIHPINGVSISIWSKRGRQLISNYLSKLNDSV